MPLLIRKHLILAATEKSEGSIPTTLATNPEKHGILTVEVPDVRHEREGIANTASRRSLTPRGQTPGPGNILARVVTEMVGSGDPVKEPRWVRYLEACGFYKDGTNRIQRVIIPTLGVGNRPWLGEICRLKDAAVIVGLAVVAGYISAKYNSSGAAGSTHDAVFLFVDSGPLAAGAGKTLDFKQSTHVSGAITLVSDHGQLFRPDSERWVEVKLNADLAAGLGALTIGHTLIFNPGGLALNNRGAAHSMAYTATTTVLAASILVSFSATDNSLNLSAGSWTNKPKQGERIAVTGSASNNGALTVIDSTTNKIRVEEVLVTEAAGASVTVTYGPYLIVRPMYGVIEAGFEIFDVQLGTELVDGGAAKVTISDLRQVRGKSLYIISNLDNYQRAASGARGNVSFSGEAGKTLRVTFEMSGQYVSATDNAPPATIDFGGGVLPPRLVNGSVWSVGWPLRVRSIGLNLNNTLVTPGDCNGTDGRSPTVLTGRKPQWAFEAEIPGEGGWQFDDALMGGGAEKPVAIQLGTEEGKLVTLISAYAQVTALEPNDDDGIGTFNATYDAVGWDSDGGGLLTQVDDLELLICLL